MISSFIAWNMWLSSKWLQVLSLNSANFSEDFPWSLLDKGTLSMCVVYGGH